MQKTAIGKGARRKLRQVRGTDRQQRSEEVRFKCKFGEGPTQGIRLCLGLMTSTPSLLIPDLGAGTPVTGLAHRGGAGDPHNRDGGSPAAGAFWQH